MTDEESNAILDACRPQESRDECGRVMSDVTNRFRGWEALRDLGAEEDFLGLVASIGWPSANKGGPGMATIVGAGDQ